MEHDKINDVIVRFIQSSWNKAIEQQIIEAYGPEIGAQTKAVYDEAMDCPVDWYKENMNSALAILADFLPTRFPWLSPEAKTSLNYCYIMVWK